MMLLRRFERTIFWLILMSIFMTVTLGLGTWYVLAIMLELSSTVSVAGVIGALVVLAAGLSFKVGQSALTPVSVFYRALDHVSADPTNAKPPKPEEFMLSRHLNEQIIKDVYDLSSGKTETQTKQSDASEKCHTIMQLQSTAVIGLDRNGLIRFANPRATDIMPASVSSPEGMSIGDTIAPEFSSGVPFNEWLSSIQGDKISARCVWERVKVVIDEQNTKYFDMIADYHKNESHGIEVIVVLVDKTEAYHVDDSAFNFVSLAVHELRSPISVLRGYIEVFQDEIGPSLDQDQQGFMAKMSASATQLATFVNNILNIARIENDQLKLHLYADNIGDVLNNSHEDFLLRTSVRKRNLVYKIGQNLPSVGVDRIGIYEVMSNLIDNAIKYSPEGSDIEVRADQSNGGVTVTVTDHGIGIPGSVMGNIFERFYRSHHSRDNVAGTGLGLYLCKTIVEAHGGTIWVRSTEGQGTTFGFDLPPFESIQSELASNEPATEGDIVRTAHGWIRNHGKMRT